MDFQTLSNLFATTISPDPNARRSAELQIRKVCNEEGFVSALLQIAATDSVDLATRHACSVWVKNRVRVVYAKEQDQSDAFKPSDRQSLRQHILPLISNAPSKTISAQWAQTLKGIVSVDFPEQWPSLLGDIKTLLGSGDVRQIHAGCVAALETVRAFRFRQKNDVMPKIVEELFPVLVSLADQLLQNWSPSPAEDVPTILHLILKTYKTSIIVQLNPHQQTSESLVPWGRLFFAVVNLQLPTGTTPEDEEERERCEWWKAKKWAYATLGRLFHRFGNPSQLPKASKEEYGAFAEHFVTVFAPEILNMYLAQVEKFVSGQQWLSQKVQYQIFSFFTECIKPKSTWVLLKPHFLTLVEKFVFPHLTFNATKQALWENDPVEYIRMTVDEFENFATPVASATTFIFSMASNRAKTTFLPMIGLIGRVLQDQSAAPQQRFGAMNMLAALGSFLSRHPDVKDAQSFIKQWIAPNLAAPEPYLRAIACEVIGTCVKSGLVFHDDQLFSQARAVIALLEDQELPVRTQAALTLTEFISQYDEIKAEVKPNVEKVVHIILQLSDETDLDLLNNSMEVMVQHFQDELLPVAAQLTQRLCETYTRLIKDSIAQEGVEIESFDDLNSGDADDDRTYTAMGVGKTIYTVINAVEDAPQILAQVQSIVIPPIVYTLQNKQLDLFSTVYDLVDSLTFKQQAISPEMWQVFELTYQLFKSDAVDFLDEMLPSLDNFVSYGSDVIAARPEYVQMLLDIYTTSMTNEHLGEADQVNGCKLAESMLMNLRGNIDNCLHPIIMTALSIMTKHINTSTLRLANLEVLVNAVLYNPSAALHIMETAGSARDFFDKWFTELNHALEDRFPRVHDKKLVLVTLSALIEMQPSTVPDTVKPGWPGIVSGMLKVFKKLPEAIKRRDALAESYEDEDEDDELAAELELRDDDEDVWDEESAYIEMLANESARLRSNADRIQTEDDDDDESESIEESDIDEELGFISPLESVNPYVVFKHALTTFQMVDPQNYQASTTSLSVDEQALLMEVMAKAQEGEQAAASA